MKDGRKYNVHQKGDREIISVSLPLRHGELLEKCTEHYNASRSEIVAMALTLFFTNIGLEVLENEIDCRSDIDLEIMKQNIVYLMLWHSVLRSPEFQKRLYQNRVNYLVRRLGL